MELQHSQTWKICRPHFRASCTPCAKYKIYALRAREDGYEQMGNIFDETSRNDRNMPRSGLSIFPAAKCPARWKTCGRGAGEHYEGPRVMRFARTARCEGLRSWRNCSPAWGTLKKRMNSVTTSWLPTLRTARFFVRGAPPCGCAWYAET